MANLAETNSIPENPSKNFYAYYRFKLGRDSPSDARDTLLVVATLIAAVTFQAGVNPPGGVWQETKSGKQTAGKSVWGTNNEGAYTVFMFSNTLAYSAAQQVIFFLVNGCPFYTEIWIAVTSMSFTYGASIASVHPSGVVSPGLLFIPCFLPFILRMALQFMRSRR